MRVQTEHCLEKSLLSMTPPGLILQLAIDACPNQIGVSYLLQVYNKLLFRGLCH